MSLTPPLFTSIYADGPDATKFRPSDLNRITGLLTAMFGTSNPTGALLFRDSGAANGFSWVEPVAAGSYMRSAGAAAAPAWSTLTLPDSATAGDLMVATGANAIGSLATGAALTVLVGGSTPAWTATPTLTSVGFSGGSVLEGSTANMIDQRNGTTAQMFRPYNTFTNSTNYERAIFGYSGNQLYIGTQKGGTGAARPIFIGTNVTGVPDAAVSISGTVLDFYPANLASWRMSGTGHFVNQTDNTYDVGQTNANRPRHGHFAGYLAIGDGIDAPGAGTGEARIYVDTADGDLKVVYADGVVKTITVDS